MFIVIGNGHPYSYINIWMRLFAFHRALIPLRERE